ncbi:hypothetical protein LEP3755_27980 [Leptolyngbya sp. NIES-3755]|nr:hypothetical protein LEP3755_27980 [Leptolyngbya sp. NIES-3755]
MELVLSKASVKFLERLPAKETEKLQDKLALLLELLETEGVIPFNELDIKSLKGDWKGFHRMRVGKVRVVFTIDTEADELQVYDIDFRGNIYKSLSIQNDLQERENRKIAVEVKSFLGASTLSEFHTAIGQCLNYRYALEDLDPDRKLYLAVPIAIYTDFFSVPFIQSVIRRSQTNLVVYDAAKEELIKWQN